jgi:hypothetical protein
VNRHQQTALDWWEPARQRELARLDRLQMSHVTDVGTGPAWRAMRARGEPVCLADGSTLTPAARAAIDADTDAWLAALNRIKAAKAAVMRPEWLPDRPARRMPSLWRIVSYWADRGTFDVDLDEPHCFACGWYEDSDGATGKIRWGNSSRWLERAHLVARVCDGLDVPQNIVPLCGQCHRVMPDEVGAEAIAWVQAGGAPAWLAREFEHLGS